MSKSVYQKWLWMLATADLIVVMLLVLPGVGAGGYLSKLANRRLLTTVLVPVVVLLLVNMLYVTGFRVDPHRRFRAA